MLDDLALLFPLLSLLVALGLVLAGLVRSRPVPGRTSVARYSMLAELGYVQLDAERWVRRLHGLPLMFTDGEGWRWSVELPRYGTLDMCIRERAGQGMKAFGRGTFLVQNPRLDERFVVSSPNPVETLHLLADPAVQELLCAVPWVELSIRADELVFADRHLDNLHRLAHTREPGASIDAEAHIHHRMADVVTALMRRMYASSRSVILEPV